MTNETIVVNIDDFNQEHINELSRRAFSSQAGLAAVSAGPWHTPATLESAYPQLRELYSLLSGLRMTVAPNQIGVIEECLSMLFELLGMDGAEG